MTMQYDFVVAQGTDFARGFVFRDCGGGVDLTGYKAAMQVRRSARAREAVDTLTTENGRMLITAKEGRVDIIIPHDVTINYPLTKLVYDLVLKSGGGLVYRVMQGVISVEAGVTHV